MMYGRRDVTVDEVADDVMKALKKHGEFETERDKVEFIIEEAYDDIYSIGFDDGDFHED